MRLSWLILALLLSPMAAPAQAWRPALTTAAVSSLWIDYSQVRYGLAHGSPTWLFGYRFTPTSIAAVNALEAAVNGWAPRRWRPWINLVTLGFHVVSIRQLARRQIGLQYGPGGEHPWRIGIRIQPW